MNVGFARTNEDCKECCCSHIMNIGSDYEDKQWVCSLGYNVNYANADDKPCGLPEDEFYTTKIVKRPPEYRLKKQLDKYKDSLNE